MVGSISSKCLQFRQLSQPLLFFMVFSLLSSQASVGRTVATGKVAPQPPATSDGSVEFTPDAVRFQDVPVGDTYTQSVRITNLAEGTLQIRKITTSNANFQVTGILLPVVVAHGTSENFTVSFRPKQEGRADSQISIFTSSSNSPLMLTVKASIIKVESELTASAAAIDFEDVAVGTTKRQEVSLTNSGTRDLTISGMSVTGTDFNASGTAAVRLSPGQSFTVEVNFAPKNMGRKSGQLTILSAEGGSPVLIPLTATAAASSRRAVKLNWEESPVTVAGYVVYRSADSSGPYTRISQATTPEFVDTGLSAGHTYYYVVTSLDGDQVESEYSTPITATVPEG
jgi:hypothetical protein